MSKQKLQKLLNSQIQIGEPIQFDCYNNCGNLLLKKGMVVFSERTLNYFFTNGLFASVESNETPGAVSLTPFQYFEELKVSLALIFDEVRDEKIGQNFSQRVESIARNIQNMCRLDADATIGLVHLDMHDRYNVSHSLHRAIVCELVGKRHGFSEDERKSIVCAALTCDLSMLNLQQGLEEQKTPLIPEQKRLIQYHPIESVILLRILGITDEGWLTTVKQHHETMSETGYPDKVPKAKLTPWSKLLALADCYTAMITPRVYREFITSQNAMRFLISKRDILYDTGCTILLMKELGAYPPGAFVKLASGETAIVIRRNEDSTAPIVKSVVGPRGASLFNPVLRDTQVKNFAILEVVLRFGTYLSEMHKLWDYPEYLELNVDAEHDPLGKMLIEQT